MATVVKQYEAVDSTARLPVSSETVGQLIRNIEARHDLLQYQIDGWCVWPLFRFPVAMRLMDLSFNQKKESFSLRELAWIAAKDLPRLLFPRRSRYVVMTYSSALMEEEHGRYKDVFFDDLLPELGSFFKIETLNNKSFWDRSNRALLKRDLTSTAFELLSTLVLPKFKRPPQISRVAEDLSASLRQEAGLESFTPQNIAAHLEVFYWKKKLYSALFRRMKPACLFSADGFSDHAVIAAAKQVGAKVYEFQHGGFIRGGPEYGWSSYAVSYKPSMPIPDQIFVFGEYWKEQLEGDGFWEGHLIPAGNMRIDRYRGLQQHYRSGRSDVACNLVLTTQGIDTESLISFMSEFLQIVEGQAEINLTLKLHPAFDNSKETYEREFGTNSRVRIVSGSERPSTFELLAAADLHLSISSTCHYDALGLGVPTVILPLANSGWVLPLHRSGHAFLAPTPEALLDIVLKLDETSVPADVGAYYFQPGAVENMKRALASQM